MSLATKTLHYAMGVLVAAAIVVGIVVAQYVVRAI